MKQAKPGTVPPRTTRRRLLQTAAWAAPLCATGNFFAARSIAAGAGAEIELGARAAAERIRHGDMTAETYAARLLKQYDDHKDLNAVIAIDESRVLEQARAVDQARKRGDKLGRLAGVPFIVKDQINVAGYATTIGTAALKGYHPKQNAAVVDILMKSGGVVFAKANLHEFAAGGTSSNRFFGFVRNPYDPTRIPGGSSGGTAAALAARIVPAGLGEDTGGSVRIPAGFCGVAGLRPSTGGRRKRYPDAGIVPPPHLLETIGPMARSVGDVALLDSIISGDAEPAAPSLKGLRIGVPNADYWDDKTVDHRVAQTMLAAFARMRDAGATLVEVNLYDLIQLGEDMAAPTSVANNDLADWLAANAPGVTVDDVRPPRPGAPPAPPRVEMSEQAKAEARAKGGQRYAEIFSSTGIVAFAYPPEPVLPPPIQLIGDSPQHQIDVNGWMVNQNSVVIHNTWFGARLGAPGLVLPAGLADGLPVGLELEGLPGDDSRLLGLGLAIEQLLGPVPPPAFVTKSA